MADESEKYPPKIQKLFAARLPLLYKKPIDYAPHERSSHVITPLSNWRSCVEQYKAQYAQGSVVKSSGMSKKEQHAESYKRQLDEWNDPEGFAENVFLKDPYRTVFVARLYYSMTELDLSKTFGNYGSIESVRIVRHHETGASRGYGFVVFERESDAKSCIRELAPTGLAVAPPDSSVKPRKILVDMERGRLVRNWLPRRLGGGLGGRHYTSPSALHSKDASAAASGRRFNLSQNPYQPATGVGASTSASSGYKRHYPDKHSSYPSYKRQATDSEYHASSGTRGPTSYATTSYAPTSYASTSYSSTSYSSSLQTPSAASRASDASLKDKYAKYQSIGTQSSSDTSGRSIRAIRERD